MKLDGKYKVHFVGTFTEAQLTNRENDKAVEDAKEKTGLKYVNTYYNKRKNVMDIFLGNDFKL